MTMRKIKCKAYGKINLSLNILARIDGFHELDMVFATVGMYDVITVKERLDNKVNIEFSCQGIDAKSNSVVKTVDVLKKYVGDFGADIFIEKNIPISGGMGGSSVDCAGVIECINSLYDFCLCDNTKQSIASECGSDVAYLLTGGFARAKGKGDLIEKIATDRQLYVVIAKGDGGVISSECYKEFDKQYSSYMYCPSDNDILVKSLCTADNTDFYSYMDNALTKPAIAQNGDIQSVIDKCKTLNNVKAVNMTGSGACVVCYFESMQDAYCAEQLLKNQGIYAKATTSKNCGVTIIK